MIFTDLYHHVAVRASREIIIPFVLRLHPGGYIIEIVARYANEERQAPTGRREKREKNIRRSHQGRRFSAHSACRRKKILTLVVGDVINSESATAGDVRTHS